MIQQDVAGTELLPEINYLNLECFAPAKFCTGSFESENATIEEFFQNYIDSSLSDL